MSHLAISLLGPFRVMLDDFLLSSFATDKIRALLAFLAVEADHPHRRAALSDLFWPDHPPAKARNNLRQALFQLRHTLATSQGPTTHLWATAKEVQFDPASNYWLDIAEFEACLSTSRDHRSPGQETLCPACQARLERAVELYRGDFMAGFSLSVCPQFELWQLSTQEACHRQVMDALCQLLNTYEARRDYDRVNCYACRKIELEPWRESAYRRSMRALALSGQRGEALHQYERCREQLVQEMGIEPSAETIRLQQQIRAGAVLEFRQRKKEPLLV